MNATRMTRLGLVMAATIVLSACAYPLPSNVTAPIPYKELPTQVLETPAACAGVGLEAVLHGDNADPRLAGLVTGVGERVEILWPIGYHARFTPLLEVRDAGGTVVLRDGSRIEGGCVTGDPHLLALQPPFR